MDRIITIGRQFGSGGREFGRRLSEELGVAYYDQEIVTEIAKRTSMSEQYVQQIIEQKPIISFPIHTGNSFYPVLNPVLEQGYNVFIEQSNIIKEMAEKSGGCVIVGRCADYILNDYNPFRIFVYADMEYRIKRCRRNAPENEHLTDKEMRKMILSVDKNRAKYYEHYTDQKWGDIMNYDLCINTSTAEIKKIARIVAKMF